MLYTTACTYTPPWFINSPVWLFETLEYANYQEEFISDGELYAKLF